MIQPLRFWLQTIKFRHTSGARSFLGDAAVDMDLVLLWLPQAPNFLHVLIPHRTRTHSPDITPYVMPCAESAPCHGDQTSPKRFGSETHMQLAGSETRDSPSKSFIALKAIDFYVFLRNCSVSPSKATREIILSRHIIGEKREKS